MDLTAEFYLQTVDTVFIQHALPKGEMMHRGQQVDPAAIKRCGLMTVEGEKDDISGVGQTQAAHRPVHQHPDGLQAPITCSPGSAITACSTARASAPKSRRASPTSSPVAGSATASQQDPAEPAVVTSNRGPAASRP